MNVKPLTSIDRDALRHVITGYESDGVYRVTWHESDDRVMFQLDLEPLPAPYVKRFDLEDRDYYDAIVRDGHSFGAYDGDVLAGIGLADVHLWNRTFWIHELHVVPAHRGRGIGRALIEALAQRATTVECRTMIVETQNTNVPAIRFYRRVGFRIEAVDVSLYTNNDLTDGEVAVYMKRQLTA
ncbi:MAG: GNAT family N-acetyltransferase [Chloroflexi bacterium]|nr:GNAT family N-acetyltransferase [Chloroflexota bacterium]